MRASHFEVPYHPFQPLIDPQIQTMASFYCHSICPIRFQCDTLILLGLHLGLLEEVHVQEVPQSFAGDMQ